jgi:hypothetical protein
MRSKSFIGAVVTASVFACLAVMPFSVMAAATCTTTFLTLDGIDSSSDPDVVDEGDLVDISSWTQTGGTPCTGTAVTEGTVKVVAFGVKDSSVDPYVFHTCSDNSSGSGSKTTIYDGPTPTPVGTKFDTTNFGDPSSLPITVGIRADYDKATGSGTTNYSQSNACVDLQIREVPVTGCDCTGLDPDIYVFADSVSALGTASGDIFEGSFGIRVKNCLGEAVDNVKIQGGAAGWLLAGVDTTTGDWINVEKNLIPGKNPKKNGNGADSFTWTTNFSDSGEGQCKAIKINVTGIVPNKEPAGTVKYLSGPWSAAWDGMKSEYTGRVSFTVN